MTQAPPCEILLADDERSVRGSLAALIQSAGYLVRTARNGAEAVEAFRAQRPNLVLLDVMMPKMNGFEACRTIRETDTETPVLFLTALDTDDGEIRALGLGADDYVLKTANPEVLLARIAAAIRRVSRSEGTGDFSFGAWRVRASRFEAERPDGAHAALSEREIAMLRLFASRPGEVFLRDWLAEKLWPAADGGVTDNLIAVTMSRLRAKLAPEGRDIETVRGSGFAYRPHEMNSR